MPQRVLTVNAGSSSLRIAMFDADAKAEVRLASDHVERIRPGSHRRELAQSLRRIAPFTDGLDVVSHRVVHGGVDHAEPTRLTDALRSDLGVLTDIAPDHLPPAIEMMDATRAAFPDIAQVVCFDTAFHRDLPTVAAMLPLPRRFWDSGIRRFGFHGLSCEYVMSVLRSLDGPAARGGIVIAHLGNGASMTAVRDGRSVETTMGFSPTGGLMMGTRSGDLDPGALLHMLRHGTTPGDLAAIVTHESGLGGVSNRSSDMRDLLAIESTDAGAADAIALFCHLARKALGGLVAVLGGIDALVFTGGIGEHAPTIRQRICRGLESFGIAIDDTRNGQNEDVVSAVGSRVTVRVIATDEDRMLARHAYALLTKGTSDV